MTDPCQARLEGCGDLEPLPVSGEPFTMPPPAPPILRPLLSEYTDWDRLQKGYKLWRKLDSDSSDPRRPCRQRALHALMCGVDGGTNSHESWAFLPWHRAFIYFHERIIEKLLHDNDSPGPFRLPAWNWEDRGTDAVKYQPDGADPDGGMCFHDCTSFFNLACQIILTKEVIENWLAGENGRSFVGSAHSKPAAQGGIHNHVHSQSGKVLSLPMDAALDPLFYAHHANMDRYFEAWKALYPEQWGTLKQDPNWKALSFIFFDENKKARRIEVAQLLETAALAYSYQLPEGLRRVRVVGDRVKLLSNEPLPARPGKDQKIRLTIEVKAPLKSGNYALEAGDLRIGTFGVFAHSGEGMHHHEESLEEQFLLGDAPVSRLRTVSFRIVPLKPAGPPISLEDARAELYVQLIEFY